MSYLGPQTATIGTVAGTVASVALFADASHAAGRMVYNDGTANCYVLYGGGTASSTNYSVKLGANTAYTFPVPIFAGPVTVFFDTAAGTARTTAW